MAERTKLSLRRCFETRLGPPRREGRCLVAPHIEGGGKKKQRVVLSGRRHCQYWPSPDIAAF
jgi:hypothetical protein